MRQATSPARCRLSFAALALASQLSLACGGDEATRPSASSEAPAAFGEPNAAPSQAVAPSTPAAPPVNTPPAAAAPRANAEGGPAADPELVGAAPTGTAGTSGEATGMGGANPGTSNTPPPPAASASSLGLDKLRIVAVGDSITQSTCWRALLWQHLNQDFPSRFDFVGSHPGADCMPADYDRDSEGYATSLVTEVVAGVTNRRTCTPACPSLDDLKQRFAAAPADVALLHYGTNDVWNGIATESIVNAYTAVVGALRDANPKIVVLVAQIIPMNVTDLTCANCTCAGCVTAVPELNARIVTWASANSTSTSPIRVVDQYTGYDAVQNNREGVHPNPSGEAKIADKWYAALAPLF
jgi:lysophospholipase L1-like esterase